ncbi:hypothetical protein B0J14DRAFT_675597 [Halenospora varia]|nr:hypothetical protein B0J14DRAFT_675597 [Halenospora varia]
MGHDLSRIVDTLYPLPKNKRLAALDALLKDKTLSKNLVKGAKSAKLGLTLQQPAKPKPARLANPQPSCIVDSTALQVWSNDPSSFWVSSQFQLDPGEGQLAAFYDDTIQLQTRHGLDAIRLRFRKLFYFDLLYLLNPRACNKTAGNVYGRLAEAIACKSTVTHDVDVTRSTLAEWVRAGRRYHKLTTTFGTAILFVLPDNLSIDFLEKRLPLEDEALDGAKVVAERLREATLEPFKFLKTEFSAPIDSWAQPPQDRRPPPPPGPPLSRPGGVEIENEPQCLHPTSESRHHNSPRNLGDDYSLDYYDDPNFFDETHTLEYYLRVPDPEPLYQPPVASSLPTHQHANISFLSR